MSAHRIVRFPALDDADEDATNIVGHLEGLRNEGWVCFHREGLVSVVKGAYRHEHQLWLRRAESPAPAVVNVNNVSLAADPGRTIHNVFAMPDGTLALSEPYATEDEARLRANAGSFVCAIRLETMASAEMVRWPGIQSALFRFAPGPDEGAIADLLRKFRRYGLPRNGGAELAVHVPVFSLEAAERELATARSVVAADANEREIRAAGADASRAATPIDAILFCPSCGAQHVDAPELPEIDEVVAFVDVAANAGPVEPNSLRIIPREGETGRYIRRQDDAWSLVRIGEQGAIIVWPTNGLERGTNGKRAWSNPPHRSHLCATCAHVWRPADVPTNGVAEIRTVGRDDCPPFRGQATSPLAAAVEGPAVEAWTFRPTHRHFKGGLYAVVAEGHVDLGHLDALRSGLDHEPVIIYRDEAGAWHVRLTDDFLSTLPDGTPRFQRLVRHTVVEVKPKEPE